MKNSESDGYSFFQAFLYRELRASALAYRKAWELNQNLREEPGETPSTEQVDAWYDVNQKRVAVVLFAACCVEAAINFWLSCHATPEQFEVLERSNFIEKWTVCPSYFLREFAFPKDGVLFQDLRRVHDRRNSLVHIKERLTLGSSVIHEGSLPQVAGDEHQFTTRCETLPKRLVEQLAKYSDLDSVMRLLIGMELPAAEISRITAT